MTSPARTALVAAAAAGAGILAAAGPAAAKDPVCPKPAHVVAKKDGGVLFRKGGSLYACTAYYGDPPRTYKLGPWSQGHSKVAFDGSAAVWTVAGPAFEGVPSDRIWAAMATLGKVYIKGVKPILGKAMDDTDRIAVTLSVSGEAVAWVTGGGAVMMGSEDPDGSPADPIGSGTPAAAPAPLLGVEQGLTHPMLPAGHRLLVGRWNSLSPAKLGKTLRIMPGDGDGDECGGASAWLVTVKPIAGARKVGASWNSGWTSSSDACRNL